MTGTTVTTGLIFPPARLGLPGRFRKQFIPVRQETWGYSTGLGEVDWLYLDKPQNKQLSLSVNSGTIRKQLNTKTHYLEIRKIKPKQKNCVCSFGLDH